MKRKLIKRILFLLLFLSNHVASQSTNDELDREISGLKSQNEIQDFWNTIHKIDQSNRGRNVDKLKDVENFKRVILMIKHHGYPTGFCYGCNSKDSTKKLNFTPNIVFTHQSSMYLREYYFQIFLKAYNDGKANEFWFLHNVRGLTLGRYSRIFYDKRVENLEGNLAIMEPFLNKEITYDISKVDSLYMLHWKESDLITNSIPIYSENIKIYYFLDLFARDKINIYELNNEFYCQKLYRDGTFCMPQKIIYDKNLDSINYSEIVNNLNFNTTILSDKKVLKLIALLKEKSN